MKVEKILECLLAEVNAMEERIEAKQERMDVNVREMKAEIRTEKK
jgi:hypothetical protein